MSSQEWVDIPPELREKQRDMFGGCDPEARGMVKSAKLSSCGTYRFELRRRFGSGLKILWVMLNPSTADHTVDDPTIKRVIHFTEAWGGGEAIVGNLYPFRSSVPAECMRWLRSWTEGNAWYERDAFHKNLLHVMNLSDEADMIVAAWGSNALAVEQCDYFLEELHSQCDLPIYCLGTTKDGMPKHPMARGVHRIPDDQKPILFLHADGTRARTEEKQ